MQQEMKQNFCAKCGEKLFDGILMGVIECHKCGYVHRYQAQININGVLKNPIIAQVGKPVHILRPGQGGNNGGIQKP